MGVRPGISSAGGHLAVKGAVSMEEFLLLILIIEAMVAFPFVVAYLIMRFIDKW